MALGFNLIFVLFVVAAFLASLVTAYSKGIIKRHLVYAAVLLLIYVIIAQTEYLIARYTNFDEAGIIIALVIGLRVISKAYLVIASLIALFHSILKKVD